MADISPEKGLKEYIKKELDKGFSIDKIKDALLKSGHSKNKVNALINELEPMGVKEAPVVKPRVALGKIVKWLLIILVIIILVSAGIVVFRSWVKIKAPEEIVEEEPQIVLGWGDAAYLKCEGLRVNGDEKKCTELYNDPKYANFTGRMDVSHEIGGCVTEDMFRQVILDGDINKCESFRASKYFLPHHEETYVEICKMTLTDNKGDCRPLSWGDPKEEELCEVFYDYIRDITIKDSERFKEVVWEESTAVVVHYLRALATKDITSCYLINDSNMYWYIHKICMYELKNGDVPEDFCWDYPPPEIYRPEKFLVYRAYAEEEG